MIDIKGFAGILDTDNPPSGVPKGFHMMAWNGRFKGVNGILRFENIEGTREITFAKPAGDNECIGAFFNPVDKQIFWCNWNSNNNHSIFVIDTPTETVVKILESGVNTDGDILNFDLDNPIHSMDIIFGSEGNFLTFVDSLGRPTEINLNLFINTPYSNIKRNFIDVAKAPFIMPPKVSYENDENVTANNFRNSLFQFRYRPVYDSNEKSVYSSGSEVPLPYLAFDQDISKDVTKNSRICIYVQTGDVNVKAIEIIGRKTLLVEGGSLTSDWFKIITLNKSELGVPDNAIYRYLFFNDGAYPTIPTEGTDPNTQVLNLQDYVPRQVNTQALLNGNVFGYAGIIEGYDKIEANLQITSIVSSLGRADSKNGILFFASQSGLFSVGTTGGNITIYLSGVGDNDNTSGEPTTLSNSENVQFYIRAQTNAGANKDIAYTETTPNATISSILTAISGVATGLGYTQVNISANQLVLSYPNIILLSSQTFTDEPLDEKDVIFANAESAAYAYGVQYFDDKGRTNGVMYGAAFTTFDTTGFGSQYELKIYHRPPIWGKYYHVVRTPNKTFGKILNWVSDAAFSNQSAVDSALYAYIGISSITEYNQELSSTSGVVSYEFSKGDRIRFRGRVLDDGTIDTTGMANLDFEILGTVQNPIVNGFVKNGTFIKILYPTNSISADFKLDGSGSYQNYQILIYNIINRISPDLELFYEWGQQYGIGNSGTANAYHAGMTQSQSSDLSNPAIILLDKGDMFYRYRNVVSGALYTATGGGNRFSNIFRSARITFVEEVVNAEYELHNNAGNPSRLGIGDYPTFSDDDEHFYNKTSNPVNIKIQTTIKFSINNDTTVDIYLKNVDASNVYLTPVISGIFIPGDFGLTSREIIIDGIFVVKPNSKVWILFGNSTESEYLVVSDFNINITVLKYTNITIVEKSFSDLYDIELSANSRATVIDENAAEIYYPTKFRWGLSYLQDTNINNVNRFYPANYDEWDRAKGDVRRLVARERLLKIFQAKGTGQTGIYTKFVQDSAGANILTTTDDIITKNNINYYQGEYGIGDYPTSLVSTDAVDIFVDPVRGYQIVSDPSGLRAINELYLGQYYIRGLLSNYNKEWVRTNGSKAKIMGVYNYVDEEYNCLLQGGSNGDNGIDSYNFSFNLKRKGYSSFFNWQPEWAISAEDKIYSWKDGKLFVHDNTSADMYCNFYDVAYECFITLPFNTNQIEKKSWQGITELSNIIWVSPDIYTQVLSYGSVFQQSNLIAADFRLKEGEFHASFLRDINSVKGISNGDKLKGTYIVIKLKPTDSSNFAFLTSVGIKYLNSPLVPA